MPLENLEEEGLEKNPNLELALWKFLLSLSDLSGDKKLQSKLMEAIIADGMYILRNFVYTFLLSLIFLWQVIHDVLSNEALLLLFFLLEIYTGTQVPCKFTRLGWTNSRQTSWPVGGGGGAAIYPPSQWV
jgi:hypothetical protein